MSMVEQQLVERDKILDDLKTQLLRAQSVMKKGADRKRREVKFKVGDFVYLKLRPYRRKLLAGSSNEKLAHRFYGPFEVEKEVGTVAYKLSLLSHCNIRPVFHVSQLCEARGVLRASVEVPSQLSVDLELLVEPEVRSGTGINLQGRHVASFRSNMGIV